jgi:hypothetical protein
MKQPIIWNVLLNLVLAVIFVALNRWALQNQFEETFVTLALFYGCIGVIGNALFISHLKSA